MVSHQTTPATPPDENARLDELHRLKLMDTSSNQRFDHYTSLVAELFDFPVVLVSFVDREKEWFKSAYGFDAFQVRKDISFCAHAISYQDVMVVRDARRDARFADNPLVVGPPYIGFYAGAVVRSPRGHPLGTLCVIDHQPREFGEKRYQQLCKFRDLIESEIRSNYDLDRLRTSIEYATYFDPLTWLPNRRLLFNRLDRMLAAAAEQQQEVAVLVFDIAGLRLINRSFGTEVGDGLLKEVGDRLIACCPSDGTVCRLEADEFVVAFPARCDYLDSFVSDARKLLDKPFLNNQEHYLRVRVGGSTFPDHGTTPAELVERASSAVRFPSDDAPSGIHFFDPFDSMDAAQRLTIESKLHKSVEDKRFHLVYQPIIDIRSGSTVYLEALLRWDDPALQQIACEDLICICEKNGLIVAIGRRVQQLISAQIRQWRDRDGRDIPVALNVSARELRQPGFTAHLLHCLEAEGVSTSRIRIELTEYSLARDSSAVSNNLKALRLASIQIYVDDFGTGYSALGYLSRMPVNGLKVDRSFILGLPGNKRQSAITLTILGMADALGLSAVAEGVETRQQLDFLSKTNCHYAQGFLLSEPVTADLVPRLWGHPLI